MAHISEYEVESRLMDRLESLGYAPVELKNYDDVLENLKAQIAAFNAKALTEAKGEATLSDSEFERVLTYLDNRTVYESAKALRDRLDLTLDSGRRVYLDFFSGNTDRNIYQVAHQITMDKEHKADVARRNRFDVTLLVNGLPLVQIELKRPGVEINEAVNQINRYRKRSFKGLFRYIQIFVVSNSTITKYFANANETLDGHYQPILKSLTFFWADEKNSRIVDLKSFATEFLNIPAITEMIDRYMVIKATEPVLMVMRPYQIYAVKAAKRRVLEADRSGFVFACTGSGKTLTSFKLAQLLRDEPTVDKVIFLVDRKDLDDQTVDEYNSFEKDCVDASDSTRVLISQLKDLQQKLLVTTIQKMANAVRNPRYVADMDAYRQRKVVFIIDECHRSQFGRMHAQIQRHFENANYIGFTGTPIFEKNRGAAKKTTADIFNAGPKMDACLHRYLIKDAIADGNVLRFSVEYQRTIFAHDIKLAGIDPARLDDARYCRRHDIDIDRLYHSPKRIAAVSSHILEHHAQHTRPQGTDTYTALFAVDSIPTLGAYYTELQRQNAALPPERRLKIAAIFTYRANEDMEEGGDEHSQELMERCMADYNEMFDTAYSLDTFGAYRRDIAQRLKQRNLPQVDILIVVNMFLTGFDAKPLNTLYLDKNLVWHSLVQAYSRTNRVDRQTKRFGQIITYRNIKADQDDALALFSGDGDPNAYLMESYDYYVNEWLKEVQPLRNVAPTVEAAGELESEDDIRAFVISFRMLAHTLATLKTFSAFDWEDLAIALTEEDYDGYKSWYLYYKDQADDADSKLPVPVDVDFDVELVRTDRVNVIYILNLLQKVKHERESEEEMKADIDLILRELERSDNEDLRNKADLMREFIRRRFYDLPDDSDIQEAFDEFCREAFEADLESFATRNGISVEIVSAVYHDYLFDQHISTDDIRRRLEPYRLGLLQMTALADKVRRFVTDTYRKYRAE